MAKLGRTEIFGDLNLKNNNLTNVGLINGLTISSSGIEGTDKLGNVTLFSQSPHTLTVTANVTLSHSTHAGSNGGGSRSGLSGATVISGITVNSDGHVTATDTRDLTPSSIGAEPAFTKNTAFNKNFGTVAGTVSEGNHIHTWNSISSKPAEYDPSAHASTHITGGSDIIPDAVAGGNSGLMSGSDKSKLNGIEANANNYIHPSSHPISMITGLQTALDGKVDNSRVLTDVPLDAVFTDTVYTHPSSHSATMITEDSSHRFVSDSEKDTWNAKQNALGYTPVNKTGDNMTGDLDLGSNYLKFGVNTAQSEVVSFGDGSGTGLKFSNSNGYISITPLNTGWLHLYTDRPKVIFNKPVYTIVNEFSSYNHDLILSRSGTTKLTLGSSSANFVDSVQAPSFISSGRIKVDGLTQPKVTKASTAPSSPVDGDLWIDTSS